ncbi:MAG: CoA transferase [Myxococcales bacterium]|nr:CoA transferase [Myxococcales bacterium]
MNDESRSLEGVKVLDISRLLPGPYCSMVLADLGAQVDKLEDPRGGDFLRVTPPFADDGMSTLFHWANRGKRSLVLDLKTDAGREAFLRLLPGYDIVLEGNRPGVMERLGLGYETLRAVHPGLIYCAITGYGQDGPLSQRAGHDLNYLARGGVLGYTGPSDRPPQPPGVQMADIGGALFALVGVLAALHARSRTGQGRFVDIAMAEAALCLAHTGFGATVGGVSLPRGDDALLGGIAPYNTYATKDGKAVSLGALEPKFWQTFCEGVGIPFDMRAQMPGPTQVEWKAKLAEIFASRTRDEWEAFSNTHDCCLEVVFTPEEVMADEHLNARGVWVERPTHKGGSVRQARTPVAPAATGVAPKQGQDSEAVLREAGFSDEDLAALRAGGAFG